MGAIKDLLNSERGIVAIALIIAATVLCALGSISTQQWLDYSTWIFTTYAAAKTITGAIVAAKAAPAAPPASGVAATPSPAIARDISVLKTAQEVLQSAVRVVPDVNP